MAIRDSYEHVDLSPHVLQAKELCEAGKNTQITSIHLGLALAEGAADGFFPRLLERVNGDATKLKAILKTAQGKLPRQDPAPDHVSPDSNLIKLLKAADSLRKKNGDTHISVDTITLATLQESTLAKAYTEAGIDTSKLNEAIKEVRGSKKVTSENAEGQFEALNKYGDDLCARAEVRLILFGRPPGGVHADPSNWVLPRVLAPAWAGVGIQAPSDPFPSTVN